MPHDKPLIVEVRGWLVKASRDLATADYEMTADPPFAEDVTFHAQQAAEKSLKAFSCGTRFHFGRPTTVSNWAKRVAGSMKHWARSFAARRA